MEFNEDKFWDEYEGLKYDLFPLLDGFSTEVECEECGTDFVVVSWNPLGQGVESAEGWLDGSVKTIIDSYNAGEPTKELIQEFMDTLEKGRKEYCVEDYCPSCDERVDLRICDTDFDADVEPALAQLRALLPVRE